MRCADPWRRPSTTGGGRNEARTSALVHRSALRPLLSSLCRLLIFEYVASDSDSDSEGLSGTFVARWLGDEGLTILDTANYPWTTNEKMNKGLLEKLRKE